MASELLGGGPGGIERRELLTREAYQNDGKQDRGFHDPSLDSHFSGPASQRMRNPEKSLAT